MKRQAAWHGVLALLLAGEVQAQNVPVVPPTQVDPTLQRNQIEQQQRQREQMQQQQREEAPAIRPGAVAGDVRLPADTSFLLQTVRFTPSKFLKDADLSAIAEAYVGKQVTYADLQAMLDKVNDLYRKAGQITARALIPPQSLVDGALEVMLVEAKIDGVTLKNGKGDDERRLVKDTFYTRRLHIGSGDTLDGPALSTAIQRFNATTPGPQVSAALAPGSRFGTTRLDLQTYEPDRLQWQGFANNYGSEGTGRAQLGGDLVWFSPTGAADSLTLTAAASKDSLYGDLRYAYPVNSRNGIVYAEAGSNSMKIKNGPYADLGIKGNSQIYALGYEQPWWINARWLLRFGAGYNVQDSDTTISGQPLSDTDLGSVALKGSLEYRNAPWYVRYEQRVSDASVDNNVTGESGHYLVYGGDGMLSRTFGVEQRWQVVGRWSWQMVGDPEHLPPSLYFQFGGIGGARGYDPGVIASPDGVSADIEGYRTLGTRWQTFVFYDWGKARQLGSWDVALQSAGVGVNFTFNKRLSANLVAAHAFDDVLPNQDDNRLLLQLLFR